jgi:thiamine-phosphate pyrophosphorylase
MGLAPARRPHPLKAGAVLVCSEDGIHYHAPVKPLSDCRLYTFVDTAYLHGRAPEIVAEQLCLGGSDLIQLRAKDVSPDEVARMAEAVLGVTRKAGVGLVINDHLAVAAKLGAEFCHLGQEDFFNAGHSHVSQLPPPGPGKSQPLIGLSTHNPEQARRALAAAPAYIAIGPVYATGTKPGAKPVTLEYVRWAAANVPIPWFAIGGINMGNVRDVLTAGARRICVVSAILNAPDIAEACRALRKEIESFT